MGYTASAYCRNTKGIPGFLFHVESSKYDVLYVQDKIEVFINEYQLKEENYLSHISGMIARKSEPFKDDKEEMSYVMSRFRSYSEDT